MRNNWRHNANGLEDEKQREAQKASGVGSTAGSLACDSGWVNGKVAKCFYANWATATTSSVGLTGVTTDNGGGCSAAVICGNSSQSY